MVMGKTSGECIVDYARLCYTILFNIYDSMLVDLLQHCYALYVKNLLVVADCRHAMRLSLEFVFVLFVVHHQNDASILT